LVGAVKKGPESYFTQKWDAELLALGPAALERTLDCIEGKAKLDIPRQGYLEIRDLGNWRTSRWSPSRAPILEMFCGQCRPPVG